MSRARPMVMFPSTKDFIEDKNLSDRIYMWILLNGKYEKDGIYISKKIKDAMDALDMNYHTLKKKLQNLIDKGYIKFSDNGEYYVIEKKELQYKRYIYRDIAEQLYNAKTDNIIKLYIVLSSYHDKYRGTQNEDFSYSLLLKRLGMSYKHNAFQIDKMEKMLDKLVELGLIEYGKSPRCNDNNPCGKQFCITKIGGIHNETI